MTGITTASSRIRVDGKFFRSGESKFHPKGVTYGPFAPDTLHGGFAAPDTTARDFQQIRQLGANLIRVYHVPPAWFLDLASQHELKVLIDIPWSKHICFLDTATSQQEARRNVRQAVEAHHGHPAVFAYSVANEIPAEIVRWSGAKKVAVFIDELVAEAKSVDPNCLCTYTSFPPTEFVRPRSIDFASFNVYLHDQAQFASYLARLQMLADNQPLLLAELGMDALREGEPRKAAFLSAQIELSFRGGLAGAIVFSYTDDWFRGERQVEDWAFGLTTRDRQPRESFFAVQRAFGAAPYFPLCRSPRVSVVVASYNGERTLKACLTSLLQLNYPDYEVILVDDGSTDNTQALVRSFPSVRYLQLEHRGLSAARNAGIAAATGEIVAFTDSDCRADEDWLYYLVSDLLKGDYAGIGGHNLLPPEDSPVAAAVMASPGGPAHVMLTDSEAEHIPGCNMAFYKWALQEIGGFDPVLVRAGDDVDVCWRLQQRGCRLGFSPGGFVWHYRRPTVKAYLRQQQGYGEAEALLALKHPECFNAIGRSIWRGRIYAPAKAGVSIDRSIIYHGTFGSGFFQRLYHPGPSSVLMLFTSLEYHAFGTLPLVVLSVLVPSLWPLAVVSLLASVAVCSLAAAQADLPKSKIRFWSRPLIALLYFLQPVERGFARYRSRLHTRTRPLPAAEVHSSTITCRSRGTTDVLAYCGATEATDRYAFLQALKGHLERDHWSVKADSGWNDYDLEIAGTRWTRLRLTTVAEYYGQGRWTLRCRLQSGWSLTGQVAFGLLLGMELLAIALLAAIQPWIWMLLLSMPVMSCYAEYEQSLVRRSIASLIDQVAVKLGLVKLPKA